MQGESVTTPVTWTDTQRDSSPFYEYRLQDAVHGRSRETFPLLAPVAFQRYSDRREIYLYVFSADGTILNHGICDGNDIYTTGSAAAVLRPLQELLGLRLYANFRDYNERQP